MADLEEPEPKKSKGTSPEIQDTQPEDGALETDETPEDVILCLTLICVESMGKARIGDF